MLAILFTILLPVAPILIWKCYNRDKKLSRGEIVVRYIVYAMAIIFFAAIMLAFTSDENTSFWEKIDKSAEFSLKYILMIAAAAIAVAGIEWLHLSKKISIKVDWKQVQEKKCVAFCRKYICPYIIYALTFLVVALNSSLMFDNVLWGDEAFSANTAEKTMFGILQVMYYWDNHPPLHYYWLKLFGELFGFSVPVLHLASLVPFFIGIVLAITVFRKKFGNIPAAFFVMISGLGPACLEYNLEVRMYSLAFLGVLGCFYCSYQVISKDRRSAWIGMVLWALVAAYSHYYALATSGIMMFCTGVAVWLKYRGKSWTKGLYAILAYILGYLPWMGFLFTATSNVSNNWWMTSLLGLDKSIDMAIGNLGMTRIIMPLWLFLLAVLLLAESGIFRKEKQGEQLIIHIQMPGTGNWSGETYTMVVGAFTIIGTIAFAYLLSLIMGPVLAERYLYPLTAVTILMLVIGSSRVLALLKEYAVHIGIASLEGMGKAVLVLFLAMLFVAGLAHYKEYSATASQQDEMTAITLETIGEPGEDVKLVTNGVQHLGWTVLYHYFPENEIVNGAYGSAESNKFWYFTPLDLDLTENDMKYLQTNGYTVTGYGEMMLAKYPFMLYYIERK